MDEPASAGRKATDTVGERMLRAVGSPLLELVDLEAEPEPSGPDGEPGADEPALHEPRLTLGEASRAAGISKEALRRRLRGGALPNAVRSSEGTWQVPVTDLLAAGLELSARGRVTAQLAVRPAHQLTSIESLELEVERLRHENAILRERLAMTETIASERQERILDLRLALRMLPEVWAERMLPPDQATLEPGPLSDGEQALDSSPVPVSDTEPETPSPDGMLRGPSNPAYWGRESALSTAPTETYDSAARIEGLRLALEAERAENDRLTAQMRRRWWPFRKAVGKHRRGGRSAPG